MLEIVRRGFAGTSERRGGAGPIARFGEAVAFAVLNIVGLVVAIATCTWMLKEIYRYAYFPLAGSVWVSGPS